MATLHRLTQRIVPPEWERELADISPPTNRFKWLKLIWEPGYAWEPVERYIIYEMTPAHAMDAGLLVEILEQLKDPHPPSAHGNYYDTQYDNGPGREKGKFIMNPDCLITERAWHLYRETGCWGKPYWVIQGIHGGHKRWFTTVEQKLLKMAGLPPEPPAPGDLPYAEWDDRVKAQLQKLDMYKDLHGRLKRRAALAHGSMQQEREEEEQKAFRSQLLEFLKEQVADIAPDVHKGLVGIDAARSKADPKLLEARLEQAEEDFVQHGDSKRSLLTLSP